MRFCILIDSREVKEPTLGRRFLRRQLKSDYFFRAQGKFKFGTIAKGISGSEFEETIHESDIVLQYIIGRGIDCTLSLASL